MVTGKKMKSSQNSPASPKSEKIMIYLPQPLHRRLKMASALTDQPMSSIVAALIEENIEAHEEKIT